ncbi:TonB-dependent receptor plug domain-containing protein [Nannocystaceae bacterium ST9]
MVAMLVAWALALAPPNPEAPAQPSPTYETVVESARDRGDGLDAQRDASARNVGFVSIIDLDHEPGQAPSDDLARVLSHAPGVTIRSVGGLGQFSAVSLRGSTTQQVAIFLDGAPLTGSLSGSVDLSNQPLDGLERIEVHRGYVPVVYGSAAIGGAIDLVGRVHRGPAKLGARLGFGSFLAREGRVGFATALRPGLSLALRAGYSGARGDFSYYDDANTPRLPADDRTQRRINNGYDRVFGQVRFDLRRGLVRVAHQDIAWFEALQVPAMIGNPDSDASQRTLVLRSITRVRRGFGGDAPGGHVEWVGSFAVERRQFRDPEAKLGLAADDEHALALDGWISPRLRLPVWRGAFLLSTAELRGEWIRVDERTPNDDPSVLNSGDATRRRWSGGLGLELEQALFDRRWSLVPALRVDLAQSSFAVPSGQGEIDDAGRDSFVLAISPRFGTKLVIVEGLDLRASVGRYVRLPTLTELFGDRGYLIGNEGLRVESGLGVDGGLVFDLETLLHGDEDEPSDARDRVDLFVQVAGFSSWARDLIQWLRNGPVVQPVNVAGARVRGLELGTSARLLGRVAMLDLAYTLLDTRNDSPEAEQQGKPLPGRPRHSLLARLAGGWRFELGRREVGFEPRALYEIEWIAGNVLDLGARVELPARLLHRVGVELIVDDRVRLGVEVRNVGDLRSVTIRPQSGPPDPYPAAIADFLGFPLPGRSVWATLGVDFELPEAKR